MPLLVYNSFLMDYPERILDFQRKLKDNKLDGFIVTNPTNIFYLTGFKGVSPTERESVLVFCPTPILITARLYQTEATKVKSRNLKVKIVDERDQIFEVALQLLSQTHLRGVRAHLGGGKKEIEKHPRGVQRSNLAHPGGETRMGLPTVVRQGQAKSGFEQDDLKFSEFQKFKTAFMSSSRTRGSDSGPSVLSSGSKDFRGNDNRITQLELIPTKNFVEDIRLIKTDDEIKRIEKAQIISQEAFEQLVKTIKTGQTEAEIAEKLTKIIKSIGADGLAFESIVASGQNSALPHYLTGKQKIKKGQVLLLDFGAKYQNYCADLSRTIFIGKPTEEMQNIYHHVLNAQKTAISKITHGIKASDAYHTANNVFKKKMLHQYFIHGLGHGVGLDIHENPYIRPTRNELLLENMVFSIEPGLYLPWGGIRIEDLVVISQGRAKVLGKTLDEIIEI